MKDVYQISIAGADGRDVHPCVLANNKEHAKTALKEALGVTNSHRGMRSLTDHSGINFELQGEGTRHVFLVTVILPGGHKHSVYSVGIDMDEAEQESVKRTPGAIEYDNSQTLTPATGIDYDFTATM